MELVVGTLAVVGIIWLIAQLSNPLAMLRHQIGEERAWPIGQLPEDTAGKIIGQVHPFQDGQGACLIAPITGRPCVYYVVRVVERRRDHGSDQHEDVTILHEETGVPFVVADATGYAIVDPRGARVALVTDARTKSGTFDDATAVEEQLLLRHGLSSTQWWFNRSLTYYEAVIEPGEHIAVLGAAVREPDPNGVPTGGYRSAMPTRLRLSGSPRHPLLISDDPRTMQR